jgi:uncharacterized protein YbcI
MTNLTQNGQPADRSVTMEVSNAMVALYKDLFGRGPTKTRTSYAGADTILVTLENSLTLSERNLAALNEHGRLRDIRTLFQHSSEQDFTEVIERITGRKVRAFVSGIDTRRDVSSEVFYLEPNGDAPSDV